MKIENAFYSKGGIRQGAPTVRVAHHIETLIELWVEGDRFYRIAPLTDAIRKRRITRRKYELLISLLTENALATGQVDETAQILEALGGMWRECPARYLPDLRPLRLALKRWIAGDKDA